MTVQARFYVREVTRFASAAMTGWAAPAPTIIVKLSPVSGSKGEANKSWASATPSGDITMTIGNPDAAKWFDDRLGQDIAITFADRPDDETT